MNVLVVAAHPDDEVLGCAGTMARLARDGNLVEVVILGEGITSRYAEVGEVARAELAALHGTTQAVARLLGAQGVVLHALPDNRFDTVPLLSVVRLVEEAVARVEPEVVYTHHGGDLNVDHAITHRAVLTATRPMSTQPVREVYAFEVCSATEWAFGRFESPFCPNTFVDISATLETKLEALRLYQHELRDFPHPRSIDTLTALAQYRGSTAGMRAAEAFELVRRLV